MNVLIINGSPKGERSNTMWLTNAFVSGFSEDAKVKTITLRDKDIHG